MGRGGVRGVGGGGRGRFIKDTDVCGKGGVHKALFCPVTKVFIFADTLHKASHLLKQY